MESLTPNIFVNDILETISFYSKLGFEKAVSVPETGTPVWIMMKCGEVSIMFQTFESLGKDLPEIHRTNGSSLLFYIKIKNIRVFFEKMKNEIPILKGLEKTFYGATEFSIADNNGYVLTFAEDE